MKTYYKLVGTISLIALIFWLGMMLERELNKWDDVGKPTYNLRLLYFDKLESRLYLKTKTWGLTGDHSLTVVSLDNNKEFHPNESREFVFDGDELFYKQTSDSLIIYYHNLISKPKSFVTPVKLKFVKYENYQAMNEQLNNVLQKYDFN